MGKSLVHYQTEIHLIDIVTCNDSGLDEVYFQLSVGHNVVLCMQPYDSKAMQVRDLFLTCARRTEKIPVSANFPPWTSCCSPNKAPTILVILYLMRTPKLILKILLRYVRMLEMSGMMAIMRSAKACYHSSGQIGDSCQPAVWSFSGRN